MAGTASLLIAALPFRDKSGCAPSVRGEYGLTDARLLADGADFRRRQLRSLCQAHAVEIAHGLLVRGASLVKAADRPVQHPIIGLGEEPHGESRSQCNPGNSSPPSMETGQSQIPCLRVQAVAHILFSGKRPYSRLPSSQSRPGGKKRASGLARCKSVRSFPLRFRPVPKNWNGCNTAHSPGPATLPRN